MHQEPDLNLTSFLTCLNQTGNDQDIQELAKWWSGNKNKIDGSHAEEEFLKYLSLKKIHSPISKEEKNENSVPPWLEKKSESERK